MKAKPPVAGVSFNGGTIGVEKDIPIRGFTFTPNNISAKTSNLEMQGTAKSDYLAWGDGELILWGDGEEIQI